MVDCSCMVMVVQLRQLLPWRRPRTMRKKINENDPINYGVWKKISCCGVFRIALYKGQLRKKPKWKLAIIMRSQRILGQTIVGNWFVMFDISRVRLWHNPIHASLWRVTIRSLLIVRLVHSEISLRNCQKKKKKWKWNNMNCSVTAHICSTEDWLIKILNNHFQIGRKKNIILVINHQNGNRWHCLCGESGTQSWNEQLFFL